MHSIFTRILVAMLVLAGACMSAAAEKVTYTKDVAPILYENCLSCHRPGEVAPMSLRTYQETRPWAKAIKEKVSTKQMPPWFADPNHGEFSNDPTLSPKEIKTIATWVDQGAPMGNPNDAPELPPYTEGWQNGEPDHVIELPLVNVPADGGDYFPNLSFKAGLDEDRWVKAIEIRPSNLEVAHHVVIFMNGFGGGMGSNFDVLGTWAVGTAPNVYPEGMGRVIGKDQRFMTNMHYHPNGKPATDQTRIGLYFGEGELKHEITAALGGSFGLYIPAGAKNHKEVDSWYVDDDIKVISFFPHMHLRGKDMRFTAIFPDGREQVLLNVPKYDFNWQLFYYPKEPIALPAGTEVEILAHYDNSEDNPHNPDPTRGVGFGTQTTDEMMFGIFEYVYDDAPKGDTPTGDTD